MHGRAFFVSSHLAARTSRMARLRPRGARLRHRSLHLGVSRGDLGVHPRCSDSPPRSKRNAADAAHVPIWPTAAPLVRNSPRGWTPRSLTTIRWSGRRAVGVAGVGPGRCRNPRAMRTRRLVRWRAPGCPGPSSRLCRRAGIPACLRACRRCCRASARPTRTSGSGRVFGAHPRGEFRTSGAAVGQIRTRAAQRPFLVERGGLSEQRGWAPKALRRYVRRLKLYAATSEHQKLCAATSDHRRLCASPLTQAAA